MSDETIDIPDITDEEARAELAVHLLAAGFESFGSGCFWELEGQTISVLLTEKHNDVFFYGNQSLRLQYDTPQILLGDWDVLMGIDPDADEVETIHEVVEDPDEAPDYQVEPVPEPAVRDGF